MKGSGVRRLAIVGLLGLSFGMSGCNFLLPDAPQLGEGGSTISNACPRTKSAGGSALLSPQALTPDFAQPHVEGELLVLGRPSQAQSLARRRPEVLVQEVDGELDFIRLKVPKGREKEYAELLRAEGYERVQPNYIYRPLALPNDPLYPSQRPFYQLTQVESVWNLDIPQECFPLVAVVDTAFDLNHEDLLGAAVGGKNLTPDGTGEDNLLPSPSPGGSTIEDYAHGQGVAGLVGALWGNRKGVAGIGENQVRILPLKVFYWTQGEYATTTDVLAKAIRYAADAGANVINLSLGMYGDDPLVSKAIGHAINLGSFVVAASGNDGVGTVMFPASHPAVLAVGSVRLDGRKSSFSNYSSTPHNLVLAPGGEPSTGEAIPSLELGRGSQNLYRGWMGTSFSAPQASAVAALYILKYRNANGRSPSPTEILRCFVSEASNKGVYSVETGYGIVKALDMLTSPRCMRP